MKINVIKLNRYAVLPTRGSDDAVGYDLYANIEQGNIKIKPNETVGIKTGVAMEVPVGYGGFIYGRSGLALKKGLRLANCVGVIDPDYRGEIIVALHNDGETEQTIINGDRIAQIVIAPYAACEFVEADSLSNTVRGSGGFGSTGM